MSPGGCEPAARAACPSQGTISRGPGRDNAHDDVMAVLLSGPCSPSALPGGRGQVEAEGDFGLGPEAGSWEGPQGRDRQIPHGGRGSGRAEGMAVLQVTSSRTLGS